MFFNCLVAVANRARRPVPRVAVERVIDENQRVGVTKAGAPERAHGYGQIRVAGR